MIVALAADHVVTDPGAFAKVCDLARAAAEKDRIVMLVSSPRGRQPSMATSALALLSVPISSPSKGSSKGPTPRPPRVTWSRATCGTSAISCSAPLSARGVSALRAEQRCRGRGRVELAGADLGFVTLDADAFARAAAKSIDYAVMERTARAAVMPVSYGWSDVGSWQAVWELSVRDAGENAAHGPAVFVDTRGSYVATEKQLVALLGLENVVVVTTADAVLVARREQSDGLRRVVGKLREVAPALTEDHQKVHRPWGSYQSLDQGERYQVKRIVVKQGGRLSLQMHHHRAEHWVVVRGTARVTIGDSVSFLHENEFDLRSERCPASPGKSG